MQPLNFPKMVPLRPASSRGFTLIEVSAALAILLPALLLLSAFLVRWESRLSQASFSLSFPFLVSAIEKFLQDQPDVQLPVEITMGRGVDGDFKVLPKPQGDVHITLSQFDSFPVVQCDARGNFGRYSFICNR
jgi:prepilin-type N-terminal cleavage/methylation domain-containing protein